MKRLSIFVIIFFLYIQIHGDEFYSLGISWMGSSVMAEEVTDGVLEILSDLVPDLSVEIFPALESEEELHTLLERFSLQKDCIVILRSSGAVFLKNNPQPIPSFFGGANNPVALGVIDNNERPGGNITGVSYYIPMDDILSFISQLVPNLSSLMHIYEEGHPGSVVEKDFLELVCLERGIKYQEYAVTRIEDINNSASAGFKSADLVVFGNQSLFNESKEEIQMVSSSVPTFSFDANLVSKGVMASFSADSRKMGRLLAGSIISVLYGGKKIGDIPVKYDEDPGIHINISTTEKLGILIPIHLLRVAEVHR